jgi:catechol 2,3-dioxygenase-like lactoylglutathione lyase family enzyme
MITGVHTMFYSSDVDELRKFIKDKLGFSYFDAGGGWLIFDLPEVKIGCHPSVDRPGKQSGVHEISLYCDDIDATVAELKGKGVVFDGEITKQEYGRVTSFTMPGGVKVDLFQPF